MNELFEALENFKQVLHQNRYYIFTWFIAVFGIFIGIAIAHYFPDWIAFLYE
jgi:hypothetical protein